MKDILEKLKEKYGAYRTEALLMVLFVVVGLVLILPGVSKDSAPASGSDIHMAQEAGAGAEEADSDRLTEGASAEADGDGEAADGTKTDGDGETADGTKTDGDGETADGTGTDGEGEAADGTGTDGEGEAADGTGTDGEGETAGGTDGEGETAAGTIPEQQEAARLSAHRFLASMPEGFRYPMVIGEEEKTAAVRMMGDWKKLPGYRPVYPQEQFASVPYDDLMSLMQEKENSSFSVLEAMLRMRLESYDGKWSVYVKNLSTQESFVIHDEPLKSASVMKLFIMGTVYKAIEDGELARTEEVMGLLENMITVSDNEASNQLLYLLGDSSYERGIGKVNAFIEEYDFSDMTIEYNGFSNSATVMDSEHSNQIAAKDCGKLLEDIYRRSWMSRTVSNEIETMLLNQQTRYKIPAGLPEGVLCGSKSGEMDTVENDAAIIYGEECDYILVVLSNDWNSKDEAISRIASISSLVYDFLN